MTTTTTPKLYTHPSKPSHWITDDDTHGLVAWRADLDGWTSRAAYDGPRDGLVEVWPGMALGTGWPREADARAVPHFSARPARRALA